MKPALIIAHKNCTDGTFAAWAARSHLERYGYVDVTVAFIDPGKTPPGVLESSWDIAFCVDVVIPLKDFLDLNARCEKGAWILDHHKTNQEDFEGVEHPRVLFDMSRSGAGLAWDAVQEILGLPKRPRPAIIDYVEDRDLWRFALPGSREVSAALHYSVNTTDLAAVTSWTPQFVNVSILRGRGETVLDVLEQQVTEAVRPERLFKVTIENEIYRAANAPTQQSEIGHAIAKAHGGVGIAWYIRKQDDTLVAQVSFRSLETSKVSAADLAKQFGGGGHRNAAGASVPLSKWLSILS